MARVARRDAPGAIHHVLLRGIERRRTFLDEDDRDDFLDSEQSRRSMGSP